MSTLSISEYQAKLAACAIKAKSLFVPKITGAKGAVPEVWPSESDGGKSKRLLAGAIIMWQKDGVTSFGHVPATTAFRMSGEDSFVRVCFNGADHGRWMGKEEAMSAVGYWPAVLSEEVFADGRVKVASVGGKAQT